MNYSNSFSTMLRKQNHTNAQQFGVSEGFFLFKRNEYFYSVRMH